LLARRLLLCASLASVLRRLAAGLFTRLPTATDGVAGANDLSPFVGLLCPMNAESKVTAEHLKRAAYLYIRQSTLRAGLREHESTQRQYALRRRALTLGWPEERIVSSTRTRDSRGLDGRSEKAFSDWWPMWGLARPAS